MMKTSRTPKKLRLRTETLRALTTDQLPKVAGGFSDWLYFHSCYPMYCNVDSDPCG